MGQCMPSKEVAAGLGGAQPPAGLQAYENPLDVMEADLELVDACGAGDAKLVAELLGKGANPNVEDPATSGTALMVAATHGNAEVVELLLKAGAAVDTKHPDFGMTALLWACHSAHTRCVQVLINAGADKKATDVSGSLTSSPPLPRLLLVLSRSRARLR